MGGRWHGQAGADKVIYGSDYPMLDLRKTVYDARRLYLDDDVLYKFLYLNINKILPAISSADIE